MEIISVLVSSNSLDFYLWGKRLKTRKKISKSCEKTACEEDEFELPMNLILDVSNYKHVVVFFQFSLVKCPM